MILAVICDECGAAEKADFDNPPKPNTLLCIPFAPVVAGHRPIGYRWQMDLCQACAKRLHDAIKATLPNGARV